MLVLSRKAEESVVIECAGEKIVVSVVEIRGEKVRLGFEANNNIPIHRKEVYKLIQQRKDEGK